MTPSPVPAAARPIRPGRNGMGTALNINPKQPCFGLPLLHVSFKYRPNRMPVVAKGVIAIGQFACGGFTLSQFGIGLISISQFTLAGLAVAQFALAYRLIAQMGIYIHEGIGQFVIRLADLLQML